MRILRPLGVALILLASSTPTHAAISATIVRSDPTPAAIAEDPALATMQSYLLRVTHTDGDWNRAGVQVQFNGGNLYNHVLGGSTQPNPALFPVFPGLEFDTYVTSPGDTGANNATIILGGFPDGPASLSANLFSVTWGDTAVTAPGTYTIARLTFPRSLDTTQEINLITVGDLPPPHQNEGSYTAQVNPDGIAYYFEHLPEPNTLTALTCGLGMLALRRR